MLGILVALIKIAELATVDAGHRDVCGRRARRALRRDRASTFDPHEVWRRVEWASDRSPVPTQRPAARHDDATHAERRAGRARLLRDVRPAVAAGRAGAARALPALRRAARLAPPPLDPVHVGARHRRGDLLHPGQRPAGAHHQHARVVRVRHHHERRDLPLHVGVVAAGADRAGRQRDDPAREAGRARLPADHGAARLDQEQPRPHAAAIAWSSSSAAGRCSTCSSTRSSSPSCSSSR